MANGWLSHVGEEMAPRTWDECLRMLLSWGGGNTIYRGHRCFEWQLQSTLERALLRYAAQWDNHKYQVMQSMAADSATEQWTMDVERALTHYFRHHAVTFGIPELPESWDKIGWWEVMQHHGAPTRTMDWTRSPFIALWFAIEDHQDGSGDMALWIYDCRIAARNHSGAMAKLKGIDDYDRLDDRQLLNQFVQFAIDDGNPALIPVQPRQFSRAVAQQSVLTVSPAISAGLPANEWLRRKLAIRLRLPEEWKADMVAACSSMELNRPALFRDLDSLGLYITQSYLNGTATSDGIL